MEFCCPSSAWGYFPTNENNRVIKGSGQHIKIKYIPDEKPSLERIVKNPTSGEIDEETNIAVGGLSVNIMW